MTQTLALHIVAAQGAATEEAKRHLPMSAAAFAILALGIFLLLLAVTWAFRSSGTKH